MDENWVEKIIKEKLGTQEIKYDKENNMLYVEYDEKLEEKIFAIHVLDQTQLDMHKMFINIARQRKLLFNDILRSSVILCHK